MYKVVTFFDTPQGIEVLINQYVSEHIGARLISCSFVYYGGEFTNAQAYCVFETQPVNLATAYNDPYGAYVQLRASEYHTMTGNTGNLTDDEVKALRDESSPIK